MKSATIKMMKLETQQKMVKLGSIFGAQFTKKSKNGNLDIEKSIRVKIKFSNSLKLAKTRNLKKKSIFNV